PRPAIAGGGNSAGLPGEAPGARAVTTGFRMSDKSAGIPQDVLEAVRTMLRWAGEDPEREGLLDTPGRVARAYKEYFRGYEEDPSVHLSRTFEEVGGYDEIVLLKDIPFISHCE